MKLRTKTLAIVGLTLLVMFFIAFPTMQWWMSSSYATIENEEVQSRVNSTISMIELDMVNLQGQSKDYALWDDTYRFVEDRNQDYVDNNLVESTYINLKLDAIVIANASGEIVFGKGYDQEQNLLVDLPDGFEQYLFPDNPVLEPGRTSKGYLSLPGGVMMISAVPVLRSDGSGPPAGTLIMGRYLDNSNIDTAGSILGINITIQPWREDAGFPAVGTAKIAAVNENSITGTTVINDIYGKPAAAITVDQPRTIYAYGQSITMITNLMMSAGMTAVFVIVILLLEMIVVSPLLNLHRSVSRVGQNQSLAGRVEVKGNDEISSLATAINNTLEQLETSGRQLHESEKKYRNLVENLDDIVWELDPEFRLTYMSPKIRNLGYDAEEVLGKSLFEMLPFVIPEKALPGIQDFVDRHEPIHLPDAKLRCKDGRKVDYEMSVSPIVGPAGEITGYSGIARDITDRAEAEKHIIGSLKEKEVLLKEIHHRVKNNLQIINSLLSLQASGETRPEIIEAFRESQNRVLSMAMVHEKLYQSDNLSRIDISDYIDSLVTSLRRSYGRSNVSLELNVEKVSLDIDTAIPCGLIVNELVTNAFKYAFSDNRKGTINVSLGREADNYVLTVSDDGVGLPPGFDFKNVSSLGLSLVNALSEQLNGSLEVCGSPGAMFKIIFK